MAWLLGRNFLLVNSALSSSPSLPFARPADVVYAQRSSLPSLTDARRRHFHTDHTNAVSHFRGFLALHSTASRARPQLSRGVAAQFSSRRLLVTRCLHFTAGYTTGWITMQMSPAKRRLRRPARMFMTSLRHSKAAVWTLNSRRSAFD